MEKIKLTPKLAQMIVDTIGLKGSECSTINDDTYRVIDFIGSTPLMLEYDWSQSSIKDGMTLNMRITALGGFAIENFKYSICRKIERFNEENPDYEMVFEIPAYRAESGSIYFTRVGADNKQKRFEVGVQRIAYAKVIVEAENEEEAKQIALDVAYSRIELCDYSFTEFELDEDNGVKEL